MDLDDSTLQVLDEIFIKIDSCSEFVLRLGALTHAKFCLCRISCSRYLSKLNLSCCKGKLSSLHLSLTIIALYFFLFAKRSTKWVDVGSDESGKRACQPFPSFFLASIQT